METLRQRLKEKDETIEKQLQTIKSAQQEKKNSDCRFHEISEHMKVKERKISVLQRKVGCAALDFALSLLAHITFITHLLRHRNKCHLLAVTGSGNHAFV